MWNRKLLLLLLMLELIVINAMMTIVWLMWCGKHNSLNEKCKETFAEILVNVSLRVRGNSIQKDYVGMSHVIFHLLYLSKHSVQIVYLCL